MNNILWQQNSCPCNEYSAEAGVAGKQEITADGDHTSAILLCDIKLDAIKHQFLDEMLIWPPQTSFLFFLLPSCIPARISPSSVDAAGKVSLFALIV